MKKGFTLSELMVAIALIGIFSTFSVVSLRNGSQEREIKNEAMKVLDGIKKMQTMALAGKSVDGETPSKYIFRLTDCGGGCKAFSLATDTGKPVESLPTELEDAVIKIDKIDDIDVSGSEIADLDISFSPPRAQPAISRIEGGAVMAGAASVVIRVKSAKDGNTARCVSVNAVSGRIDLGHCL